MIGFLPIEQARYSLSDIAPREKLAVTWEQVKALAPKIQNSRAAIVTMARNSISDDDLLRLLWIELALREPAPRREIVARILGRIHTRERMRIVGLSKTGCEIVKEYV